MGRRKEKKLHYAKHIDVTGEKYHMLTAIRYVGTDDNHASYWLFRCNCGHEKIIALNSVRKKSGYVSSCGCLDRQAHQENPNHKTHGMCGTRIYRIWKAMKNRCNNPNSNDYERYGRRGIKVCPEWLDNFMNFYSWAVVNGYDDSLSIDRIDNDKGYCPENCRWTTVEKQNNNRSSSLSITYNGENHTASEWEKITGIKSSTIRKRISMGWDVEKALYLSVRGGDTE